MENQPLEFASWLVRAEGNAPLSFVPSNHRGVSRRSGYGIYTRAMRTPMEHIILISVGFRVIKHASHRVGATENCRCSAPIKKRLADTDPPAAHSTRETRVDRIIFLFFFFSSSSSFRLSPVASLLSLVGPWSARNCQSLDLTSTEVNRLPLTDERAREMRYHGASPIIAARSAIILTDNII